MMQAYTVDYDGFRDFMRHRVPLATFRLGDGMAVHLVEVNGHDAVILTEPIKGESLVIEPAAAGKGIHDELRQAVRFGGASW